MRALLNLTREGRADDVDVVVRPGVVTGVVLDLDLGDPGGGALPIGNLVLSTANAMTLAIRILETLGAV